MKEFGGSAFFIDRDDINTDEIIPAKYLTEITKRALQPHLLEDLFLDGKEFDTQAEDFQQASVLVTRSNFGCGSSREHAVWALEVNDINVVLGESFARIFRQNMFNCGILAVELSKADIDRLFALAQGDGAIRIGIELEKDTVVAENGKGEKVECSFSMNPFDKELVAAGGWLAYADQKY
ncbi:MAG: 3-isopropylmalate dehydratase small subunit [Candidatus Electrothrix aestuarii]|uniref:3-isopropylmalate dehydratase n=1 Tax=Candidatus Electrothrix aestuarii TaxID=3062594 RepID=A0AAU8LW69_9BACT|nr:3-isopropylmalate dehydratase small subunit [Candidatus Electrothrix aestuarii]